MLLTSIFPHSANWLYFVSCLLCCAFFKKKCNSSWLFLLFLHMCSCCLSIITETSVKNLFFLQFSSKGSVVSGFTFKFLIHFKLIFWILKNRQSLSDICVWKSNFSNTIFLKDYFLHWVFSALLSNISWPYVYELISGLLLPLGWNMCLFLCPYHVLITKALYL